MAYFWLENGWHDFIYNVLFHNLDYIGALTAADRVANLKDAVSDLSKSQALIWVFSIVGIAILFWLRELKWLLFLSLWLMTSAVGVNASGYFFPHYFQALLPVFSLAAAIGASGLDSARFWDGVPALCRRAALVFALALLPGMAMWPFLFQLTPKEAVSRIYPTNPFAEMPEVGRRLAEVTRPEDRVFVFGSEPEALFYARRASATRYIILFPLFGPYADAREKQIATSLEITRAHPAAALYLPNRLFYVPGAESYLTTWSIDYLRTNFQVDRWLAVDSCRRSSRGARRQRRSTASQNHREVASEKDSSLNAERTAMTTSTTYWVFPEVVAKLRAMGVPSWEEKSEMNRKKLHIKRVTRTFIKSLRGLLKGSGAIDDDACDFNARL